MRILVIEDVERIRAFLARGLASEGFAVDEAADGEAGLRLATSAEYDLVILDLLLPQMSGLDVLRTLRAKRPDLPVVILSARSELRTKLEGFRLGANDYVSKPFSFEELLARVRVQLRRHTNGSSDGNRIVVGELTLDLARHAAAFGDTEAELTAREFALLHHLALRPGEVVSRDRLLSDVWGYHFDPHSNVVDVCVRRLRKKFGHRTPIETVRHAGYRLPAA
jgi:DNA-binding response OmpR family regulator